MKKNQPPIKTNMIKDESSEAEYAETSLQYSMEAHAREQDVKDTECVLDTGCAVAMASTEALYRYKEAVNKHCNKPCATTKSHHQFGFAGGHQTPAAKKWSVPTPLFKAYTEFHEVAMATKTSNPTPLLMSVDQQENLDGAYPDQGQFDEYSE